MSTKTKRSFEGVATVVDTDVHLTESQADLMPYLEGPFAELIENAGEKYGGFWGNWYPAAGYFSPMDTGRIEIDSAGDPRELRDWEVEVLGVDRAVLNPTQNLGLGYVHHDELSAALAHAYNEYLLDTYLDDVSEFYGSAVVSPQKPYAAAEEIDDRADESKIVSIMFPTSGLHPPAGHSMYDPIYDAIERSGLPVCMHNGVSGLMASFPLQWRGFSRFMEAHAFVNPAQHMVNVASIITHGVPERFPDLDFVIMEAGLGWIPYYIHRLDEEYSAARHDAPELTQPPSAYFEDQFYFTSQPIEGTSDPNYVRNVIDAFGGQEKLMFSSDYPHFDFDHSDALLDIVRGGFEDGTVENVFSRTADRVFGF